MTLLAIQTALHRSEWALLKDGQILAEVSPEGPVDELSVFLQNLMQKAEITRADLTGIFLIKGPGSFTSLRSGIAFGNALAHALHLPMYELSTLEYLRLKTLEATLALLWSGGLNAVVWDGQEYHEGALAVILKDFSHDVHTLAHELPETLEKELHSIALEKNWTLATPQKTLGQVLADLDPSTLEQVKSVEPWYLHPPKITLSSDPFKR